MLKDSAEYFNSSNEARGAAYVPNEDDDRVLVTIHFTRRYTCTRNSYTFQRLGQCEKCLVSEIVTIFKLRILVNPATNAVSENTIICRLRNELNRKICSHLNMEA